MGVKVDYGFKVALRRRNLRELESMGTVAWRRSSVRPLVLVVPKTVTVTLLLHEGGGSERFVCHTGWVLRLVSLVRAK